MATGKDFVLYLQDCLRHVRSLRFKSMFGEYAMYADDVVVALVCDQTVFIKVTAGTTALLAERVKSGFPFPGAKPAYMLTEAELEDDELMTQVIAAVLRDREAKGVKTAKPSKPAKAAKSVKKKAVRRKS